jgi:hypothetical protein
MVVREVGSLGADIWVSSDEACDGNLAPRDCGCPVAL